MHFLYAQSFFIKFLSLGYSLLMKLIYDNIVFGIQRFGGISVVWQELLSRMSETNWDIKYIDVDAKQLDNYSRGKLSIPGKSVIQTIRHPRLSRWLPVRLQSEESFIFHSSYYRYCVHPQALNVTTVHDFTYELFVKGIKQKLHTWQKFSAIRHSAAIVCISEHTKRDLLKYMPDIEEKKVSVIYNGVSDIFRVLDEKPDDIRLPFPINSYVVFIGRRDSYKNFELVVKCVAATSFNLLVVGSPLSEAEKTFTENLISPERYQCMSHVPDERLNELYNYAAALVYPSAYEGFGLPVLEAQRAGCPVIALNASSIPEVIGKTPLLMSNLTEQEMINKLCLLSDIDLRNRIKAEGQLNSQRFSWEKMHNQYQELYQELMKGNKALTNRLSPLENEN